MLNILTNVLTISLFVALTGASEPYCVRNESIIIKVPVMKTRQRTKSPTGFFKVFKKTKVYTESYQDFEDSVETKIIRGCCEGYRMSRFDICEPMCANSCPKNAHCIEPNRCHCERGYISEVSTKDGSHYCKPICNGGCPANARCAEPDVCECEHGYHTVDYRCIPRTDTDYEDGETSTPTVHPLDISDEDENIENAYDLDESEKIYLSTPEDMDYTTTSPKCPPNYVLLNDICHPQVFASNEIDCTFKPCVEHAYCQDNGTCACEEGYSWYNPHNNIETESSKETQAICLTEEEIYAFLKERRLDETDSEDEIDWWNGSFIALGVLCMIGALCFLAVKLLRHSNGKMHVEVKNDLYCTYDGKNSKDIPHVL